MKKGIASISLFVFMLMSCGVVINSHYCMNKLDSTDFYSSAAEVCGKCGMHIDDASGCCRDEVKIIKLEDDQKVTAQTTFEIPTIGAVINLPSPYIDAPFANDISQRHLQDHSPPIPDGQDLHVRNCVFRI
jgi:hypothetical protein